MTIQNRTFDLPAVWANDATTTVPTTPTAGVTYRNGALDAATALAAWPYRNIVDSANTNQYLYLMAAMLNQQSTQGLLSWNAAVSYPVGALVLGSNGLAYRSLVADNINHDPATSGVSYWSQNSSFVLHEGYGIMNLSLISLPQSSNYLAPRTGTILAIKTIEGAAKINQGPYALQVTGSGIYYIK